MSRPAGPVRPIIERAESTDSLKTNEMSTGALAST
jgi:hypothetical protein